MSSLTAELTTIDAELARLSDQLRNAELQGWTETAEGARRRIDVLLELRLPKQRDAEWKRVEPTPSSDATR